MTGVAGSGGTGGDVARIEAEGDTESGEVVRSAIVNRRVVVVTGEVGTASEGTAARGL